MDWAVSSGTGGVQGVVRRTGCRQVDGIPLVASVGACATVASVGAMWQVSQTYIRNTSLKSLVRLDVSQENHVNYAIGICVNLIL